MSAPTSVKQSARDVIYALSDSASWSDLMYVLELRADIEAGIADADADRVDTNWASYWRPPTINRGPPNTRPTSRGSRQLFGP